MFRSIQWKITALYSLLILFAMQLIGVYTIQALERYYLNNFIASMETQGELVASFVEERLLADEGEVYIADILQGFIAYSDLEIMVLDRFGRVIGDFEGGSAMQSRRILQEEIGMALAGNRSEALRLNPQDQQRHYYLALPIKAGQTVLGVVYLTGSLEQIDQTLDRVKMILLSGSALVLGIVVLLGIVLARTITVPIQEVTNKAAKMARGDFSLQIKVYADDEIGQLGKVFNYLAARLKKTLQQISTEKSKVETILNYMSDGIIAFNKKGDTIHLNTTAKQFLPRLTGCSGTNHGSEILKPLFAEGELDELLVSEKPVTREISVSIGNGEKKLLRAHFVPLTGEEASFSGTLVAIHDITQERELLNLQQEFVANVSHELRTPLTTIKSYVETLLDGAMKEPALLTHFLRVVESETERMVNLVRDLLTLSQLDSQQFLWRRERVGMSDVVREVVDQLSMKIKERKLTLNIDIDGHRIPALFFDRNRIKQVWLNLIDNAIKYTPSGGEIYLTASLQEESVCFSVRDTGVGIPEDQLQRIFERFYRVDKDRSRQRGGTGLGLAIAQEIINTHEGEIWVESEFGNGTTVTFSLPRMES